MLMQVLVNGITLSSTYILIALGLVIIYGIMHILQFAHGEIFMLGAFGAYFLYGRLGLNYFLALIITMITVAFIGLLLERYLFRPVSDKFMPCMVMSLGLAMVLQCGGWLAFGIQDKSVPHVLSGSLRIANAVITIERLVLTLSGLLLVAALYLFVKYTKLGQAMRATEQDPEAAALQGISHARMSMLAFFIGCALAGAAGVLVAPTTYLNPNMGQGVILIAFWIIIVGGRGSVTGAIVAGFLIGLTESFATTYLGTEISSLVLFGSLILVLSLRPGGIFGRE